MPDSLAGKLLVATPVLTDPNFYRTVVLILAHDEQGAFGVVLNRPLAGVDVGDHLPRWAEHAAAPATVFDGGPVEPTLAVGVASRQLADAPEDWRPMTGTLGLVDLATDPEQAGGGIERVRVFSGYAGWGAGQLEGEVGENAWWVVGSEPSDVFDDEPGDLWRRVLLRQPGDVRIYAYFPEDASAN